MKTWLKTSNKFNGLAAGMNTFAACLALMGGLALIGGNPYLLGLGVGIALFASAGVYLGYAALGFTVWKKCRDSRWEVFKVWNLWNPWDEAAWNRVGWSERLLGSVGALIAVAVIVGLGALNGLMFGGPGSLLAVFFASFGFSPIVAPFVGLFVATLLGFYGNAVLYFNSIVSTFRKIGAKLDGTTWAEDGGLFLHSRSQRFVSRTKQIRRQTCHRRTHSFKNECAT